MSYRAEQIVIGLTKPINPYSSILLGALTAMWGIWLLMPWSVFGTAPLFSKLERFAPEDAWGAWATACGTLVIFAVWKGLYKWLYRTLAFGIWHWCTVAGFMWWGDWHNTGGVTYSFVGFLFIYLYLNIKINYKQHGENIPNFYS